MAKAKFKLILGRRRNYPLNIELEVYNGPACRVIIGTGIVLDSEKQWDGARQMVIKSKNAEQYNKYLHQMIDRIVEVEDNVETQGLPLTPDIIKLAAKSQTAKGEDVFEVFGRYIEEETDIRTNTRLNKHSLLRTFQKFIRVYKKNNVATLYFGEVNVNMIKALDVYYSDMATSGSVKNLHANLRKWFKRAVKEGLLGSNPYDNFSITFGQDGSRQALTGDQLSALESIDRSLLQESRIKEFIVDMFLFSCYTGLRYSDVSTLTRDHVQSDAHGYVLQKKTIKTGILVTLPLYSLFNGKPQAIVEKYLQCEDTKTIFPHMTKPRIDANMHRLGKLLNLPFTMTFHVARHTCASQLAERADNPFVIMNVLGHGQIQTSMHYIHSSHKTAAKKLANVKWEEDMTPEEIAQSDEAMTQTYESIREVCQRKRLSSVLTRFVIGFAVRNIDHAPMITEWIGKIRKTDYTIEAFEKRLEMVVG